MKILKEWMGFAGVIIIMILFAMLPLAIIAGYISIFGWLING